MPKPDDREPRPRRLVDPEQAFAYYAALPATKRTYAAVAAHFGVSVRTIETHGRSGGWKKRLHKIDAQAAAEMDQSLLEKRIEQVETEWRLLDATRIQYAENLRNGRIKSTTADLERMHRLSNTLLDARRRLAAEMNAPPADEPTERTPTHVAAVVDALADTGALAALGLTRIAHDNDGDDDEEAA